MSRFRLRRGFLAVSVGLLSPLAACTLTSDSFRPEEVIQSLDTPDAGSVEPAPILGEPNDGGVSSTCVAPEELAGCELTLGPSGRTCSSDLECETRACVAGTCAPASCRDGVTSGDESGEDCGGSCPVACAVPECTDDSECPARNCQAGRCQPATCDDAIVNQGESATDCAGPCAARCGVGDTCTANTDCGVGLFCPEQSRRCTTVSCQDGALNGAEILTDCGGGDCPGCPVGTACSAGTDCLTGVCDPSARCAPASCDDGVRNQNETGVDCGGTCQACSVGEACDNGRDCQSGVCNPRRCGRAIDRCCQAPSCSDGVANGTEPIADCGNAACGACPINSPCSANGQCSTGLCQAGACRLQPCANLRRDGTETDIDCGGSDLTCRRCAPGASCSSDGDCASQSCEGGTCADCGDGARNGTESDIDCGGNCAACSPGQLCNVDIDCQSGACEDGRCCGGVLGDCTRCARRLASALTCASNGDAAVNNCNAFLQCLADNPRACPVRHADGCSDAPTDACFTESFGGNAGPGVVLADNILGTAECFF